jgi:hypothetical protein
MLPPKVSVQRMVEFIKYATSNIMTFMAVIILVSVIVGTLGDVLVSIAETIMDVVTKIYNM